MKLKSIMALAVSFANLTGTVLFTQPAYASLGGGGRGDGSNMAAVRHDGEDNKIKLVRIEGALSCDLGAENDGQSCDLKLHESKTGRTYNLVQAKSAMQLYQDGTKNVAIEGRLEDSETLEVRKAQSL